MLLWLKHLIILLLWNPFLSDFLIKLLNIVVLFFGDRIRSIVIVNSSGGEYDLMFLASPHQSERQRTQTITTTNIVPEHNNSSIAELAIKQKHNNHQKYDLGFTSGYTNKIAFDFLYFLFKNDDI